MEATEREIYGSGFFPAAGSEGDCLISRRDLEILLHGSETEKEKGYRNLASAVAASAGLGVLSTLTSHFGELWTGGLAPGEAIFLILALSATISSSMLAVFFHHRVQRSGEPDRRLLNDHIRGQLENGDVDPRRWP